MKKINVLKLSVVAFSFWIGACGTIYKETRSIASKPANEVVIVGKIELIPKIKYKDSDFQNVIGVDSIKNRVVIHLSNKSAIEKTNNVLNPRLDEHYYFNVPKDKSFLSYGQIYTRMTPDTTSEILLPAPLELDVRASDKAVYFGTWRMHRDEFNSITKFEVIDEYDKALEAFHKKFGSKAVLRKAIIKAGRLPASK
jgi:hypothetical protein